MTVGERVIGTAPLDEEVFVEPGAVTVGASAAGYDAALRTVSIAKGASADVALTLTVPRRSLVPAFVTGGAGAAALVTGIGLFAGGPRRSERAVTGTA